jgi:hypothetical protein
MAALPVEQRPASIERVRRNDNAEEGIDTLVEEVQPMQFTQRFGTSFDPTGAKTGAEILTFAQRSKDLKRKWNGGDPGTQRAHLRKSKPRNTSSVLAALYEVMGKILTSSVQQQILEHVTPRLMAKLATYQEKKGH